MQNTETYKIHGHNDIIKRDAVIYNTNDTDYMHALNRLKRVEYQLDLEDRVADLEQQVKELADKINTLAQK